MAEFDPDYAMRLIDQVYGPRRGPVDPRARAGLMPGGEIRSRDATSAEDLIAALAGILPRGTTDRIVPAINAGATAGNAILDYGPLPARLAVEMAKQPVRAGEAVGEALHDPTLANLTNAGVQTGIALLRPAHGFAALTGGLGLAALQPTSAAEAQERSTKSTLKGAMHEGPAAPPEDDPLDPSSRQRLTDLQRRQQRGDRLSRAEREEQNTYLATIQAATTEKATRRAAVDAKRKEDEQAEFARAVQHAEAARNFELADNPSFRASPVGQVWNKVGPVAPGLLAFGLGGLSRAASGGGTIAKDYVLPGLTGALTGAAATNLPLAGDAFFTPVDNPERRAYSAYARELPPSHPRKQEWTDYALRLPEANPIRKEAAKELYDPTKLAERVAFGAVEGVLGGIAGSEIVRLPGRLADTVPQLAGRAKAAHDRGMEGAALASAGRQAAEGEAAVKSAATREARAVSDEARAVSDEARRRKGADTAGARADDPMGQASGRSPASQPADAVGSSQRPLPPPDARAANVKAIDGPRKAVTMKDSEQILRNLAAGRDPGDGLVGLDPERIVKQAEKLRRARDIMRTDYQSMVDIGPMKWGLLVSGGAGLSAAAARPYD